MHLICSQAHSMSSSQAHSMSSHQALYGQFSSPLWAVLKPFMGSSQALYGQFSSPLWAVHNAAKCLPVTHATHFYHQTSSRAKYLVSFLDYTTIRCKIPLRTINRFIYNNQLLQVEINYQLWKRINVYLLLVGICRRWDSNPRPPELLWPNFRCRDSNPGRTGENRVS